MKSESGTQKKDIVISLFGKEFSIFADEHTLALCDEIRNKAKEKLNSIKESDNVFEDVKVFLMECINKLAGQKMTDEFSRCCTMSLAEVTGILCCIISEIGRTFCGDGDVDVE